MMVDGVSTVGLAIPGPAQVLPQGQGRAEALSPSSVPPPADTAISSGSGQVSGASSSVRAPPAGSGRGGNLDIAV